MIFLLKTIGISLLLLLFAIAAMAMRLLIKGELREVYGCCSKKFSKESNYCSTPDNKKNNDASSSN